MIEINVFSCQKTKDFDEIQSYIKNSLPWAKIQNINKFSTNISKSQMPKINFTDKNVIKQSARKAYENAYLPHLSAFNIALDEKGAMLDSLAFAKLLQNESRINFFIGGAYGFSSDFKNKMQKVISFSPLTMAHKIAKLVLFEQIYRALSINAKHPYHK